MVEKDISSKELVKFLKGKHADGASFTDRLKIAYRPYICPFNDLLNALPSNTSVYDIGCGSGMFLSLVKEFKSYKKLAGIEISAHLINNAEQVLELKTNNNISLTTFDGQNIPEEISDYAFVFMIDVFHHIPKNQQMDFLNQLIDKMGKNATLVFKDIEGGSIFKYWNKIHDMLLAGEVGNEVPSEDLVSFFKQKKEVEIIDIRHRQMLLYPHFTISVKKII